MSGSTSSARFKIDGKVYRGQAIEDITLNDAIMFDSFAAEAGWGVTLDQVEAMAAKETLSIRESMIVTAVTVWLMKRAAGEDCSLREAAEVKASAIEQLAEPGDKKAPKAKKKGSRTGSAPAAVRLAEEPDGTAPLTLSSPQSETA